MNTWLPLFRKRPSLASRIAGVPGARGPVVLPEKPKPPEDKKP